MADICLESFVCTPQTMLGDAALVHLDQFNLLLRFTTPTNLMNRSFRKNIIRIPTDKDCDAPASSNNNPADLPIDPLRVDGQRSKAVNRERVLVRQVSELLNNRFGWSLTVTLDGFAANGLRYHPLEHFR